MKLFARLLIISNDASPKPQLKTYQELVLEWEKHRSAKGNAKIGVNLAILIKQEKKSSTKDWWLANNEKTKELSWWKIAFSSGFETKFYTFTI